MDIKKYLEDFSEEIVPVLTNAAIKALQIPNNEGIDFASVLISDAQKYSDLVQKAKGVNCDILFATSRVMSMQQKSNCIDGGVK